MQPDFSAVMRRLSMIIGADHDAALARLLGLSSSDFAQRKKRGKLPLDRIVALACTRGIGVDWLLTGAGDPPRAAGGCWDVIGRPPGLVVSDARLEALLMVLAQLPPPRPGCCRG